MKYGVEGTGQYITRQTLRENPFDDRIQTAGEIFGEDVKVIIGKNNYIAIYQNVNCGGIIVNCIEVADLEGYVIERLY